MANEKLIRRAVTTEIKEINDEDRTLVAYATTKTVDSYNEVLLPDSFDLERYRKNPVLMWGHDYRLPPIGRSMWIKPDSKGLLFKPQFAKTQFAEDVFNLYREGFLRGFSVGFDPKAWLSPQDEEYQKLLAKWGIEGQPDRIYTKNELYEVSAVPLPANEDALMLAINDGVIHSRALQAYFEDLNLTGVTPFADLPLAPEDLEWDAAKARKQLAKWASSDGSGDKDKMDWKKYRKGFFWYDTSESENFGSYKLPFAYVIDGTATAVWRAVAASMIVLLGGRGGVDIPEGDRKAVYNHIVRYYKKFDKEPPEFKSLDELMLDHFKALNLSSAQLLAKVNLLYEQLIQKQKIDTSEISLEEARRFFEKRIPEAVQREIRRLVGKID